MCNQTLLKGLEMGLIGANYHSLAASMQIKGACLVDSSQVKILHQQVTLFISCRNFPNGFVVSVELNISSQTSTWSLPLFTVQYTGCKIVCVSGILLTRAHPHNDEASINYDHEFAFIEYI